MVETETNLDNDTIRMNSAARCLVVLGMHRSGTSALTGVLSLLGIQPGHTLLQAMEEVNPKGFWEHAEIVSIHNELLNALDSSWHDANALPDDWLHSPITANFSNRIVHVLRNDFGSQPIWLIKDPRMCRLLPLWQQVFRELTCQPLFILALRNPAEVARSLRKRDDLAEEASCLLWLTHMLDAEYQTRGQPRAFVNYERLLTDWRSTIANISQTLNLTWPVTIDDATPHIEAFLDPSLRHHFNNDTLPDHPACRLAQEGFELLSTASPDLAKLDRLRARTAELARLIEPWSKRLQHGDKRINDLLTAIDCVNQENAALRSDMARIKNTVSWNITKPLRTIWNALRSLLPND